MPFKNKEEKLAYRRKWYAKNAKSVIKRVGQYKKLKKDEFIAFKKTLSCVKCGQNHHATLDFHHVVKSPDNKKIHNLTQNFNFKEVHEEIKKCIVLCANCHRIHHYDEHQEHKKQKKKKKKKGKGP
jgi:hypothetical protein